MAIAKMALVNITGDRHLLDDALLCCTYSEMFHPEQASALVEYSSVPTSGTASDTYNTLSGKLQEYVETTDAQITALTNRQADIDQDVAKAQNALKLLEHLVAMDLDFDDLWSCQSLKVRFGRLPIDSYDKLDFYKDRPFVFYSFDNDGEYHWCLYVTATEFKTEIDGMFSSLFFERMHVPDYAHGTPEQVMASIRRDIDLQKDQLAKVQNDVALWNSQNGQKLTEAKGQLQFMNNAFEMRKYVGYSAKKFTIVGFIPEAKQQQFTALFKGLDVELSIRPGESDMRLAPPVELKNKRIFQPFEMFVTMYGLPSYNDFDPTPYVAVTYTLLFGIMFGDLGQGLLLSLLGAIMWRWKKMQLGRVMTRMGLASAFFGCLYGSVFGNEHLLDPMYHALGMEGKPIEVMEPATTSTLLIAAVAMGAVLIVISILINIVLGFKHKDWERAIFSNNGVAGLVFYGSVLYAAVATLVLGQNVLTPLYISLLIALPLLIIFLKEPLGKVVRKKSKIFEEGVGGFIVESFFEMFEVLLSFVTNTMSFLRVGGFILSHAGMMLVVMTLSEMVGSGASPVVLIIGNLFVMGMEGLIVGIQVLRLEFYEIFSRFFDGDGKAYTPFVVEHADRPA